jgi:hypothetical protein
MAVHGRGSPFVDVKLLHTPRRGNTCGLLTLLLSDVRNEEDILTDV